MKHQITHPGLQKSAKNQQKSPHSVKTTHCQVQQNRRKVYVRTEFLAVKHQLKPTSYKAVLPAGCRWHQECSDLEPASCSLIHSNYFCQKCVQHSKLLLHKHVKARLYNLLLPESNRSSQIQLYHLKYN